MPIPIRTLRAHADDLPKARPLLSARELDREDRIRDTARALMFRFGRVNMTFHGLAIAIRRSPANIPPPPPQARAGPTANTNRR